MQLVLLSQVKNMHSWQPVAPHERINIEGIEEMDSELLDCSWDGMWRDPPIHSPTALLPISRGSEGLAHWNQQHMQHCIRPSVILFSPVLWFFFPFPSIGCHVLFNNFLSKWCTITTVKHPCYSPRTWIPTTAFETSKCFVLWYVVLIPCFRLNNDVAIYACIIWEQRLSLPTLHGKQL